LTAEKVANISKIFKFTVPEVQSYGIESAVTTRIAIKDL